MCLVVLAQRCHPRYRLVIAANRDEFHDRPTLAAAPWLERDSVYGGRDLSAGGAWMAADRRGRVALVTNIRGLKAGERSRGLLVRDLLLDHAPITAAVSQLQEQRAQYRPFNLIAGTTDDLWFLGSDGGVPTALSQATHTLSNASLDTPWPKTRRLAAQMRIWCAAGDPDTDALFVALADTRIAVDAELPDTGIGIDHERFLSSPFIVSDRYGTRCSSVYSVDREGNARLQERSFGPQGVAIGNVDWRWRIEAS